MIIICTLRYSSLSRLQTLFPWPLRRFLNDTYRSFQVVDSAVSEVEGSGKVEITNDSSLKKMLVRPPINKTAFIYLFVYSDLIVGLTFN